MQKVVAHIGVVMTAMKAFGPAVTVSELLGAGTATEIVLFAAPMYASFYLGAIIGSLAVATGRAASSGATLADVVETAMRFGLYEPSLLHTLHRAPTLFKPRVAGRGNRYYPGRATIRP